MREYWIIDPQRETVEVFTLGERGFEQVATYSKGELLHSLLLVGLAIDLKGVFA